MREIYEMFRGTITPEAMVAAAGTETRAQFYAQLYAGLYFEALGNQRFHDERRAHRGIVPSPEQNIGRIGGRISAGPPRPACATLTRLVRRTAAAVEFGGDDR